MENEVAGFRNTILLGASLALLAACERPSAVARYDEAAPARSEREPARASTRAEREDAPVKLVDGKPMWSASRRGTAEENAQRSFERNGRDFAAKDVEAFVQKAHDFVDHPPARVQKLVRANGDTLLYDPKDNVFAVVTRDGAPRTMFKPEEGQAYWDEQLAREERRKTAAANRGEDRDEG
jgi:pyocin large subunit-like protein